jgi:deoxyribodipyrimidine photolyase-related protein
MLYWDFLLRHESRLRGNRRMALQLKNLTRFDSRQRALIRKQAESLRGELAADF